MSVLRENDAIFTRVSVRQFANKAVEPDMIERILRAAMAAPSATNQQPWEFFVVTNRTICEKLSHSSDHATPAAGAPVVIVPCMRKSGLRAPDFREIDLAIATENILLEVETLGLGAVMLGVAPREDRMKCVTEILDLPDELDPFALVAIGWPADGAKRPQQNRWDANRVRYYA